ncbi:MAG: hypothetical protein M1825_002717 [Sarcosagium campestre]|nr:MAG: hypothetical protein M1825_002717 [Sarcosagium campestre]
MEGIHGVDVSWLHHPHKDKSAKSKSPKGHETQRDSSPLRYLSKADKPSKPIDIAPRASSPARDGDRDSPKMSTSIPSHHPLYFERHAASDKPDSVANKSPISSSPRTNGLTPPAIPSTPPSPRRGSWLSGFTSKFGSSTPPPPSPDASTPKKPAEKATPSPKSMPPPPARRASLTGATPVPEDELEPYTPAAPKQASSSFFQNALKRISSSTGQLSTNKAPCNGGLCQRRIMNVDPNRERCRVVELDQGKLRRVAFCVDVEIAGGPVYANGGNPKNKVNPKAQDDVKKLKEKGEGEALKNPEKVQEEKENDGVVKASGEQVGQDAPTKAEVNGEEGKKETKEAKEPNKRKEKKKKSEEERKLRKEKKRKQAEANGTVPIETLKSPDDSTPTISGSSTPKSQDHPTTDPLRIYRRCCQLRETPVLKRITEQLTADQSHQDSPAGGIASIDLTGYWMQLADIVTLADWLSIVPVRRLVLDNCGLGDEGIRSILGALLAIRTPAPAQGKDATKDATKEHQGANGATVNGTDMAEKGADPVERHGAIEKLTLKNNPQIGREGWRHLSLFVHMSRTIKAIDVSGIPFPRTLATPEEGGALEKTTSGKALPADMSCLLAKAISERLAGSHLEELIMSECELTTQQIANFIGGITKCGVRRLGFADNNITQEGLQHIAGYVREGVCEGLDLGGNQVRDHLDIIVGALDGQNPLYALCLADCGLTPASLTTLFPALVALPNFRFIDLSRNKELFSTRPGALGILRRYLPRLNALKRLHLEDVSLSSDDVISLAEILPESKCLAHLSILENEKIQALASAQDEASQEEACALYASLMVAVRVSETIICVDVEVPTAENSEVVKALARQVVAYCLRNMERGPVAEFSSAAAAISEPHGGPSATSFELPEVLQHIVGAYPDAGPGATSIAPAPDNDYVIGGTGVVKALGVCLGSLSRDAQRASRDYSNPGSGTGTPRPLLRGEENLGRGKAKEMSKDLLNSARKIRARLRPALIREGANGDDMNCKRLLFLDQTLERMIQRFEDEYPECRLEPPHPSRPAPAPQANAEMTTTTATTITTTIVSKKATAASDKTSPERTAASPYEEYEEEEEEDDEDDDEDEEQEDIASSPRRRHRHRHRRHIARSPSDAELALRAQAHEEGQIHRIGQQVRRDILSPSPSDIPASRVTQHDDDPNSGDATNLQQTKVDGVANLSPESRKRVALARERIDGMQGSEFKELASGTDASGASTIWKQLGLSAQELQALHREDAETFEKFRQSQLAAQKNVDV